MKHKYGKIASSYVNGYTYDKTIELSVVKSGNHKGEIRIEVGREPDENFPEVKLKPYSKYGKRSVKTAYLPLKKLVEFLENEGLADVYL